MSVSMDFEKEGNRLLSKWKKIKDGERTMYMHDDGWLEEISNQINTDMDIKDENKKGVWTEATRNHPIENTKKQPTHLSFSDLMPNMQECTFMMDEIESLTGQIAEKVFGLPLPEKVNNDNLIDGNASHLSVIYAHNEFLMKRMAVLLAVVREMSRLTVSD